MRSNPRARVSTTPIRILKVDVHHPNQVQSVVGLFDDLVLLDCAAHRGRLLAPWVPRRHGLSNSKNLVSHTTGADVPTKDAANRRAHLS